MENETRSTRGEANDIDDLIPDTFSSGSGSSHQSVSDTTQSLWRRFVPSHIQHVFLPQHPRAHLLPGEEIQLEIHLAWYRDITAILVYNYGLAIMVIAFLSAFLLAFFSRDLGISSSFAMQLPFFLVIALVGYSLFQHFQYSQWRLIKTNARLIISMPQPDAWYLVDNIEMNSMPRVIDANWSQNNFTRGLQALTGARDLYISLVGLQFAQGGAVVKDALIIPDVDDEDVQKLKALVFTAQ